MATTVTTRPTSVTEKWIDFARKTTFNDLPQDVVHQTKMYILDHIGCALGGYSTDAGKVVLATARELGGKPESTVIGSGDKMACTSAAYANTRNSNLLDSCECTFCGTHIGGVPLFSGLAVGERVKASGKDLILSTALGFDICLRYMLSVTNLKIEPSGEVKMSETSGLGYDILGAVTAASKILKLDKEQMTNAFGIAGLYANVGLSRKWMKSTPSHIHKYADMGWFALSGMAAALFARLGDQGDRCVLDGDLGLWKALGALSFDYEIFIQDLGTKWHIMDAGIKPYPVCRWLNAAVALFKELQRKHNFKPEDIDSIVVTSTPGTFDPIFVGATNWAAVEEKDRIPQYAQFSFSYNLAMMAYGIPVGPEWTDKKYLNSPEIIEFTKKVKHVADPEAEKRMKQYKGPLSKANAKPFNAVEVRSKKGTFKASTFNVKGDSWNPEAKLSDEEFKEKFRNNAIKVLTEAKINSVIDTVGRLEDVRDVAELTALLSGKQLL